MSLLSRSKCCLIWSKAGSLVGSKCCCECWGYLDPPTVFLRLPNGEEELLEADEKGDEDL